MQQQAGPGMMFKGTTGGRANTFSFISTTPSMRFEYAVNKTRSENRLGSSCDMRQAGHPAPGRTRYYIELLVHRAILNRSRESLHDKH